MYPIDSSVVVNGEFIKNYSYMIITMSDMEKLAKVLMANLMAINDTLAEIRDVLKSIQEDISAIGVSMPT